MSPCYSVIIGTVLRMLIKKPMLLMESGIKTNKKERAIWREVRQLLRRINNQRNDKEALRICIRKETRFYNWIRVADSFCRKLRKMSTEEVRGERSKVANNQRLKKISAPSTL